MLLFKEITLHCLFLVLLIIAFPLQVWPFYSILVAELPDFLSPSIRLFICSQFSSWVSQWIYWVTFRTYSYKYMYNAYIIVSMTPTWQVVLHYGQRTHTARISPPLLCTNVTTCLCRFALTKFALMFSEL